MKKIYIKPLLLIGLSWLHACMQPIASTKKPGSETELKKVMTPGDERLVNAAYASSLMAVRLSEEAMTRSISLETKKLANQVIKDNNQVMHQLKSYGASYNIDLPIDMDTEQVKQWRMLVKQKSWNFDKAYIDLVTDEHARAIKLYHDIADNVSIPEIKLTAKNYFSNSMHPDEISLQASAVINTRFATNEEAALK